MNNDIEKYWFRIEGNERYRWSYVFPIDQIRESSNEHDAFKNLGGGKVCEVVKTIKIESRNSISNENWIYDYVFFDRYKNVIAPFNYLRSDCIWRLLKIEEDEIQAEVEAFGFRLLVEDPEKVQRRIPCKIYERHWRKHPNRFMHVIAISIDYFLSVSRYESWSNPDLKEIVSDSKNCYKTYEAIYGIYNKNSKDKLNVR